MSEPCSVLLVEDNRADARLMQVWLAEAGEEFALTQVGTLTEALGCLKVGAVDVVLLDLGLPDEEGLASFQRVHLHAGQAPVIVLTGLDDTVLAMQAVQGGAQDFLAKQGLEGETVRRSLRYARERAQLLRAERQARSDAQRAEQFAREQAHVLELLAQHAPVPTVLEALAALVRRQVDGAACAVMLREAGHWHMAAAAGLSPGLCKAVRELRLADSLPGTSAAGSMEAGSDASLWAPLHRCLAEHRWILFEALQLERGPEAPEGVLLVLSSLESLVLALPPHVREGAVRLGGLILTHAALADRLSFQAQHDALTGLPNRALFRDRLDQALTLARRQGLRVAVLFIDLDGFKRINDALGHRVGDDLLRQVAARFQAVMRSSDTLARLGGDEFLVVLNGLTDTHGAAHVAQALLAQLASPFVLEGRELQMSASIGLSFFPDDAEEAGLLQRHADAAMYQAKAAGRGRFQCFTADLNTQLLERLALEQALRQAVLRQEFALHYQPQWSVAGELVGFEALLRWQHPQWGWVPPARFVPIAEECGLIRAIGRWVLEEACRQCAIWRARGATRLRMAVNVSSLQFEQQDWLQTVQRALAAAELAPDGLELELTERIVMPRGTPAAERLQDIRTLGVATAIDDFGTGYSSLAYLQNLPVDTLKIDQSFVAALVGPGRAQGAAIVEAVVELARGLGLRSVAEGVETAEQQAFLCALGCDSLQGYLLGRPAPALEWDSLFSPCAAVAAN